MKIGKAIETAKSLGKLGVRTPLGQKVVFGGVDNQRLYVDGNSWNLYCPTCDELTSKDWEILEAADGARKMAQSPSSGDCPDCKEPIRAKTLQEGGGIVCSAGCGYWFCY